MQELQITQGGVGESEKAANKGYIIKPASTEDDQHRSVILREIKEMMLNSYFKLLKLSQEIEVFTLELFAINDVS